jgi:predicted phosphate transport protein (TIGR00153 family)
VWYGRGAMAINPRRPGLLARLLPQTGAGRFFELFEQHGERTCEAARVLAEMVRLSGAAERQAERVKAIEHQGDEITHAVIEQLHQTFITPMDRDDIHRLMSRMDDVLDLIYAASERLWLYRIDTMEPEAVAFADVLVRATDEMAAAVRGLRDLGNRAALLRHCTEVNRLENEGDQLLRQAVARLFHERTDAIHVIKWKEIYDTLENAIDRCEDVANVIEGVALEYA